MKKHQADSKQEDGLAAILPVLNNDIERLSTKLAAISHSPSTLPAAIGMGMLGGSAFYDPILSGLLLGSISTYEGGANSFGELKAGAEDMVDDLLDELTDLDTVVNAVEDGVSNRQKATQSAAATKAQQVATAVQAALDKARDARRKAKGVATAAKKLAVANPKLRDARISFREASQKLRQFDRLKAAANTKAEFTALATLLKDARTKIDDDLTHLNEAMELVV